MRTLTTEFVPLSFFSAFGHVLLCISLSFDVSFSSALTEEQARILAHLDSVLVVPEGMEAQDGEEFIYYWK